MANRRFNDLKNHATLPRQPNAPGSKLTLKPAGGLVDVDAFARGDAMCGGNRHVAATQYSKVAFLKRLPVGRSREPTLVMSLDHSQNVVIHYQDKKTEQKDEANLDESLFEGHAQIPAQQPFDRQHQQVAAIQNWYR